MIHRLNPRSTSSIEKIKTVPKEKIIHKGIEMILFHKFQGRKYRTNENLKEENSIALVGNVKRFECTKRHSMFLEHGKM